MFKRIISALLSAATLAALAVAPSLGEADRRLVVDPASPVAVVDGSITVACGTSASELLACLADRAGATLADRDGNALSTTDTVTTGAVLALGDDRATVIVPGEVNGDSKINVRDVLGAMSAIVDQTEGLIAKAADVDCSGVLNAKDVVKLMRFLVGWDEKLGAENEKAQFEDESLEMYFTSPMLRVAREETVLYGERDGLIRLAKNEIEDAHLILLGYEAKTGLTLDVGSIENSDGAVLEREVRYGYYYDSAMFADLNSQDFQNLRRDGEWWADPYPVLKGDFNVGENENQSFIVKVKTTAKTAPGWYSAPICVLDADGREIKKATLRVYVWDFAIEDEKLSYTMFNTGSGGLASYFGSHLDRKYYNGDAWSPIYKECWYDYCLENKMCLETLPYDLYEPEVDAYLDDPRVTSFMTVSGRQATTWDHPDTEAIRRDYAKLSGKREWLEKAYIYTVDEPYGEEGVEQVKKQWNGAKSVLGDTYFQTIIPFGNGWMNDLGMDFLEATYDYCNAFCPLAACFTYTLPRKERNKLRDLYPDWGEYLADGQVKKYGQFEPRYEALRERGDKMWWYICIGPYFPHANFWNSYQGAWARVVLWQQYRYNADGFLYWCLTFWNVAEHDSRMINLTRTGGGDGLLLYPGSFWDEGPTAVPSIRFEVVRDGLEDFAYLRQLEAFIGRDAALAYSDRVTTDVLHFSQDWHDIDSVRDEIGFMLEELYD